MAACGYSQVHAARDSDPPFRRSTWRRANPGLDALPDLEAAIRREARQGAAGPVGAGQLPGAQAQSGHG